MTFWALLYSLIHHDGGCIALTQSTRSTIVYGGSCLQAFWVAVASHGAVAWEFVS